MSFVLRFFHAPQATTVRAAINWADGTHPDEQRPNPHFARFVESITEYYPSLTDDDDEGLPNLWPEGLECDEHCGAVVNIMVNTDMLEAGVMSVIARHADAAGLQILDEQNGLLFGPGLQYIHLTDTVPTPLPEVSAYAESVMVENLRGLRFNVARTKIAEACRRAAGKSFELTQSSSVATIHRQHGALRQLLSLRIMRSTDKVSARVYCRVGFACEALAREWMSLLPPEYAKRRERYDASAGGFEPEFAWYVSNLTAGELPAALSLATESRMRFANAAELQQLIDGIAPWIKQQLRPFLDRIDSVDALLPLCISDAALRQARSGRLAFPVYPAMLALARRAGANVLEEYAAAFRANSEFRRICALFKDPEGAHFDALVEGLRR